MAYLSQCDWVWNRNKVVVAHSVAFLVTLPFVGKQDLVATVGTDISRIDRPDGDR